MLKDALKELDEVVKGLDDKTAPETLEVDREGFIRHVTKNIAALKTDKSAETRTARLKYLGECLEVAKNFEGPTDGAMTLPMFKDPGQLSTTDTSGALGGPAGANPGGAATTHGDDTHPSGVPTPPSGAGNATPPPAGPSGAPFADPTSNFAKALGDIQKMIEQLSKAASNPDNGEPPKPDPKPAPAKAEGDKTETTKSEETTDEKTEAEKKHIAKMAPAYFPADMNDEDPDVDDSTFFGYDKGSELEKRHTARVAAKKAEAEKTAQADAAE